jgi:hypothetical protein
LTRSHALRIDTLACSARRIDAARAFRVCRSADAISRIGGPQPGRWGKADSARSVVNGDDPVHADVHDDGDVYDYD